MNLKSAQAPEKKERSPLPSYQVPSRTLRHLGQSQIEGLLGAPGIEDRKAFIGSFDEVSHPSESRAAAARFCSEPPGLCSPAIPFLQL